MRRFALLLLLARESGFVIWIFETPTYFRIAAPNCRARAIYPIGAAISFTYIEFSAKRRIYAICGRWLSFVRGAVIMFFSRYAGLRMIRLAQPLYGNIALAIIAPCYSILFLSNPIRNVLILRRSPLLFRPPWMSGGGGVRAYRTLVSRFLLMAFLGTPSALRRCPVDTALAPREYAKMIPILIYETGKGNSISII